MPRNGLAMFYIPPWNVLHCRLFNIPASNVLQWGMANQTTGFPSALYEAVKRAYGLPSRVWPVQASHPEQLHAQDGRVLVIHRRETCAPPCPWHSPRDHALADRPLYIRTTIGPPYLALRICPHGEMHPDPDSLEYCRTAANNLSPAQFKKQYQAHVCDGCCRH